MILTCPECATRYSVPDGSIGASGRKVRCQSCAHVWTASAHDEPLELTQADTPPAPAEFGRRAEDLAEAPAPELPRAFRARAEQQRRMRRAAASGAVWAGLASVFVGLLAAGWLFRVDVVEIYPRAAAAYAAAGVPVNPTGLEFEALGARPSPERSGMVMISGAVRNVRDQAVDIPTIRVALLDADGAEIGHVLTVVPGEPLNPGDVRGFAVLSPDPGGQAADIGVTFVKGEAAVVRAPSLTSAGSDATVDAMRPVLGVTPEAPSASPPVNAVSVDAAPGPAAVGAPHPLGRGPVEAAASRHG